MLSEGLDTFLTYVRECQMQYRMAIADEQDANNATQDILHSIELDGNGDFDLLRLTKVLHTVRCNRRSAKNTIAELQPIVDWANQNKQTLDQLGRVLGLMRKEYRKASTRIYAPRSNILDHIQDYFNEDIEDQPHDRDVPLDLDESFDIISTTDT